MGFLKSLFSSNQESTERSLNSVEQLRQGDAVEFSDSFALPENLRKQSFTVKQVNTYQYERSVSNEFVLQGNTPDLVYLSYEKDDEEWLNVTIKVNRNLVEQLFDLDNFADIFEPDSSSELALKQELADFHNWLAPIYFQHTNAQRGYYYDKDYRPGKPPAHQDSFSHPFDLFGLTSADEKFSVDVEVWEDGDTDVSLTIHRPVTDIVALYPGK